MKGVAAILLAAGILGSAACGGGTGVTSTTAAATTSAASTTAAALSPADLGDEVGALYLAAYDDLVALLADRPDAATVAGELTALKEQYIQEMVALGRRRETMGTADRATVDARITAALDRLPAETYDAYQLAFTDYGSDLEVANLIAAFNILGQYANFDLLREQAPEEAERLGI
jgi:hypothetical protein